MFEASKRAAAHAAAALVQDGMVLGLGSGSTSMLMLREVAERGLKVQGVPTSLAVEAEARRLGIPLLSHPDAFDRVDLALDGADEVDPQGRLIKGGGGALLREKLVATASARFVVMIDPSKRVEQLGAKWAVPVEVISFGQVPLVRRLQALGATVAPRLREGTAFVTDGGNHVLDCHFGAIRDVPGLHARIKALPGVVETGLFFGITDTLITGAEDGSVQTQQFSR